MHDSIIDLTNGKYINILRKDKSINKWLNQVDDFINHAKVKEITIQKNHYQEILNKLPAQLAQQMLDKFMYRGTIIKWVNLN
jgi:replicative superfamily II helicase